ncbi:MAG: tryptophan synthase subunit alpha [Candidatus Obscuribacterales bacterium]|nr:tryptophan synthase subunit alpha [Candidatus Obscuribacterales bacterium]
MRNRIDETFNRLGREQRKAFIPFTVLGYPYPERSLEAIETMIQQGATALELGLAFSDPMADGPLIENADKKVVENGFSTKKALQLVATVRQKHANIPISIMTYFNLIYKRGAQAFMRDLKEAGVDGITIVDLPPEEGAETFRTAHDFGIAPIMLISPLTSKERLPKLLQYADGYLYLVSRAGITGLLDNFDRSLDELVRLLKTQSDLPIMIGFGISKPEQANRMLDLGADGVIVGSKIIDLQSPSSNPKLLSNFVNEMSNSICRFIPEKQTSR